MKIKRILWKIFSSTGIIWLWIDFLNNKREYSGKNLIFYSTISWVSLFIVLFATIHSPIYGIVSGLLLVFWVLGNTLYRISESLGAYFITMFFFSIFVGVWILLSKNAHIFVNLQ